MIYSEKDVLDIINSCIDENPTEVLEDWHIKRSNTLLTETEVKSYNNSFVWSFDLYNIHRQKCITVTLVDLYSTPETTQSYLMTKYLGYDGWTKSYTGFSHDNYLHAYVTVHSEMELPEVLSGLHSISDTILDEGGNEFEYRLSYELHDGGAKTDEDVEQRLKYIGSDHPKLAVYWCYGVMLYTSKRVKGWKLGDKINENIKERLK